MKPHVQQALARLEGGAELPCEPHYTAFVLLKTGRGLVGAINPIISDRKWGRWIRQKECLRKKLRQRECASVPLQCASCGAEFYRRTIQQIRCESCIAAMRKLRDARKER